MKKYLLLLSLSLFAYLPGYTQNLSGAVMAGGSLTFSNASEGTNGAQKTKYFNVGPQVGVFLSNNWAVGLHGGFSRRVTEDQAFGNPVVPANGYTQYYGSSAKLTEKAWQLGPFARYYHPLTDKLFLFGHAQAGISRINYKIEQDSYVGVLFPGGTYQTRDQDGNLIPTDESFYSSETASKTSLYAASISPGLVFFPKPLLGIEVRAGEIGYTYHKTTEQKTFFANLDFSNIKFGLSFYFGRASAE